MTRALRTILATARAYSQKLSAAVASAWTRSPNAAASRRTSITHHVKYIEFCAQAASDSEVFRTFRREPIYVQTLEHVSEDQGREYLRIVERDNPRLLDETDWVRLNDACGSPITFSYPRIGNVSPVTLRYLKVLSDLTLHFGDLSGLRVVEIGVGYGGQCRLVADRWPVESYTLIDLEAPLLLAQRYLETLGERGPLILTAPDSISAGDYDLCISNYAFSELSRPVQTAYADLILKRSARAYLTCNFVSQLFGIDSWTRGELQNMNATSSWLGEEPETYPGNAILVWGTKSPSTSERPSIES